MQDAPKIRPLGFACLMETSHESLNTKPKIEKLGFQGER